MQLRRGRIRWAPKWLLLFDQRVFSSRFIIDRLRRRQHLPNLDRCKPDRRVRRLRLDKIGDITTVPASGTATQIVWASATTMVTASATVTGIASRPLGVHSRRGVHQVKIPSIRPLLRPLVERRRHLLLAGRLHRTTHHGTKLQQETFILLRMSIRIMVPLGPAHRSVITTLFMLRLIAIRCNHSCRRREESTWRRHRHRHRTAAATDDSMT